MWWYKSCSNNDTTEILSNFWRALKSEKVCWNVLKIRITKKKIKEFRAEKWHIEKAINENGKCKGYVSSFNSWIDK